MNKVLSIIVPSYNMEAYLPKCLGSLIVDDKELLQKLDVIVVNDGSKDRTSEIAHGFEAKYPGVFRVIDKANGHYGSCINAALPLIVGVFVKVLDADDWLDTAALKSFLRILMASEQTDEKVDLFLTDFNYIYSETNTTQRFTIELPTYIVLKVEDCNLRFYIHMHSVTYRADILSKMNYKQTEGICYTDNEWTFYPMSAVRCLRYEPIALYQYLIGRVGQSVAPGEFDRNAEMFSKIYSQMVERWNSFPSDMPDSLREFLVNRVINIYYCDIFLKGIWEIHTLESDAKLKLIDQWLLTKNQYLHSRLVNALKSKKMSVNWFELWRKNYSSRTFLFEVVRIARRFSGFLRSNKMFQKKA